MRKMQLPRNFRTDLKLPSGYDLTQISGLTLRYDKIIAGIFIKVRAACEGQQINFHRNGPGSVCADLVQLLSCGYSYVFYWPRRALAHASNPTFGPVKSPPPQIPVWEGASCYTTRPWGIRRDGRYGLSHSQFRQCCTALDLRFLSSGPRGFFHPASLFITLANIPTSHVLCFCEVGSAEENPAFVILAQSRDSRDIDARQFPCVYRQPIGYLGTYNLQVLISPSGGSHDRAQESGKAPK